ncbi:MAG: response regulator, partial [Deltaproteobacteria bacterium]|nr:response regulator [Deltaproteobacteria bacterium]
GTAHRQAEENYRTLFREMLDGFALHEIIPDAWGNPVDYRFLSVNPAFEKATGLKADDIVGRTVLEVLPATEDHLIQTYGRVALTGEPVFFENSLGKLNKQFKVTAFRPAPNRFACIFEDITERQLAEAENARLQDQLQQAQKMEAVGTLAGGIAHDFNNLLQAINGFTGLLLWDKSEIDPDYPKLKAISTACGRAAQLVKQLLLFSRKVKADSKPLELNREIEHAKTLLERTIPKMIDIELHLGSRLWAVKADSVQIEQMLLNIGGNAADAMPDGGKLVIATQNISLSEEYADGHIDVKPGNYVLLSISDTGQGMDKEILQHIFDPFYTTKEIGKGTGLGLASVYGIVKGHGGYITCYSEVGLGTTFNIYLPALEQNGIQLDIMPAEENPVGGTETILLADDEESIRELASAAFMRFGYKVIVVASGEEALEAYIAGGDQIDLVMLDLGMPGMGGYKCLHEIMQIDQAAKVIIVSGYSIADQKQRAMDAGAAGYVAKPYQLKDLLNKVRAVLDEKT